MDVELEDRSAENIWGLIRRKRIRRAANEAIHPVLQDVFDKKTRNGTMLNFRPSCREFCFVAEAFGICRFYVQFKAGRGGRAAGLLTPAG